MSYTLRMCDCGQATVYARGKCFKHYQEAWKTTTTAPLVHGRRGTYTARGCRCALCRAADTAYKRKWRSK